MIKPPCNHDPLKAIKNGIRRNKNANVQRYMCTICFTKFSFGQQKLKFLNPKILIFVISEFKKGKSFRKIANLCKKEFSIKVSHNSIRNWLRKDPTMFDYSPYHEKLVKLQKEKLNIKIQRLRKKIEKATNRLLIDQKRLALLQEFYSK